MGHARWERDVRGVRAPGACRLRASAHRLRSDAPLSGLDLPLIPADVGARHCGARRDCPSTSALWPLRPARHDQPNALMLKPRQGRPKNSRWAPARTRQAPGARAPRTSRREHPTYIPLHPSRDFRGERWGQASVAPRGGGTGGGATLHDPPAAPSNRTMDSPSVIEAMTVTTLGIGGRPPPRPELPAPHVGAARIHPRLAPVRLYQPHPHRGAQHAPHRAPRRRARLRRRHELGHPLPQRRKLKPHLHHPPSPASGASTASRCARTSRK